MIQRTSLMAYFGEVISTLGERQAMVLNALLESDGLTNAEIGARLNKPINTITPRTLELRAKGLVIQQRIRRCNVTGRNAIAWQIKPAEIKQAKLL